MISGLENRTDITYKDYELCAEWKAEDNESSIRTYVYNVYWDKSTDELLAADTTSSERRCHSLGLNDTEKYYFKVSAQNDAGLWGENKTSSSIQVDTRLSPVGCKNGRQDGNETDLDCGGDCGGFI